MAIQIKAQGDRAELFIYEEIAADAFFGGMSAQEFARQIGDLDAEHIDVRINSPGGDVFEGIAIANAINRHSARVVAHVDGLAASIASVIAMAADRVVIAENAMMMIHNAWTVTAGNAEDLRSTANVLEQVDNQIVGMYETRSTLSEDEIRVAMSAETWMTSEEAVADGFADEVATMAVAACVVPSHLKYKHTPRAYQPSHHHIVADSRKTVEETPRRNDAKKVLSGWIID